MKSKARLQEDSQAFIDDMIEFSCQSMQWCADESENAAKQVGNVIGILMQDAKRISIMSTEAVALLQAFKQKAVETVKQPQLGKTTQLIKDLQALCGQEHAVQEFVNPVIEALQFQDRITQMMNNKARMIATWALARTAVAAGDSLGEDDRVAFGKKLLECTTMGVERGIIHKVVPGLPKDDVAPDAQLF